MFKSDFLDVKNPYAGLVPRNFEFKVPKMVVKDNVEF